MLGLWLVLGSTSLRADISPLFVSPPSTNQPAAGPEVATGWVASPDTNVVGYYLCWGLASGQCTNFIDVGNVTNATLGGLTTNVLYYFTVVAYDAFGDQAVPSNEIQYIATNNVALTPPTILADLTGQSVAAGSTILLQVQVAGSDPLSYQWQFNGADIPGATDSSLSLADVTLAQAGPYQVFVSNAAGSVASSIAILAVATSPTLSQDLVSQSVPAGSNATFQVGVAGTGPFSYQWLFNGAALAGASANPLVLPNVLLANAGTYQVVVSSPVGAVTSSSANLIVLAPPALLGNLSNQTVASGLNAAFQVGATGTAPLGYQWLFNGALLSGATSNVLNLANVSSAQAGSYQVVVTNQLGKAASSVATLQVIPASSLRIAALGNGSFKLTFGGGPSQNYAVQYSANVNAAWQTLATVTTDPLGIFSYVATPADSAGLFRVSVP